MLFVKTNSTNTLPNLSQEQALNIYDALKTKDANRLFLEDNVPTEHTIEVETELKRIESEVASKMRGADNYVATTKANLVTSITSTLLNVEVVVTDIINWFDGNPDENTTWDQFKASFLEGE